MKKLVLSILAMALIVVSCENSKHQETTTSANEEVIVEEVVSVELKNFNSSAENLVGKQISLAGTVDHVCKHGGQKLFIVNEDSDARVKVTTGENMAAFNTELEGESIELVGILEELRIDEDYLREWEEELKAETGEDLGEAVHMGEHKEGEDGDHHEEKDIDGELEQIAHFREKIKDSDKDYLSFYSVLCVEYKVVEVTEM